VDQEGAKRIEERLPPAYFAEIGDEIIVQANERIDAFCASQSRGESVEGIASHL
jgi:hypothetical protein